MNRTTGCECLNVEVVREGWLGEGLVSGLGNRKFHLYTEKNKGKNDIVSKVQIVAG